MPESYFGGQGGTSWSGWGVVYSDGIGLPTGRQMVNGSQACIIHGLRAGVGGRGGSRVVRFELGGSSTGEFWIGSTGTGPGLTGWVGSGGWLVQGGSARMHVWTPGNGAIYFSKGGGGQVFNDRGTSWPGTLYGGYQWVEGPTAPRDLVGERHPNISGAIYMRWSPPASDGGTGISDYEVFRNNTLITRTGARDFTDTGLTPGTNYTYYIRARNWVASSANTASHNSNSITIEASGPPSEPRSLTATASTTVYGRVTLGWTAPANDGYGPITEYDIYADATRVAVAAGSARSIVLDRMTQFREHRFDIRARNTWNNSQSPKSNDAYATPDGPPGAPSGLVATADQLTPGKIDLSWNAPTVTGAGGITGYNIWQNTGVRLLRTTTTDTTASITGLNPGEVYTFYVTARNAISQAQNPEGQSAPSNNATAQALGEPPAPSAFTAVSSATSAGRITLTWTPPAGTNTGYSVFRRDGQVDRLLAKVNSTTFSEDNLTPGTYQYVVRARNSYTDTLEEGYPGNWGGPASVVASATATNDSTQAITALTVPNQTNTNLSGTYTVNAVTATAVQYSKVAAPVAPALVPSGGAVENLTNASFSGTFVISTPTGMTITYTSAGAAIAPVSVSGASLANTTNQRFNGTYVVPAGGVNVGARTVKLTKSGAVVGTTAVPQNSAPGGTSTITNNSNAVYNTPAGSTDRIIEVTETGIQFIRANGSNLPETNAAGVVTNITNRDQYNGTRRIVGVPSYNTIQYATTGADQEVTEIQNTDENILTRLSSAASLEIEYRAGWVG